MDNKKFPPLEPENNLPEVFPEIPEKMEPLEDLPLIEELSFEKEPQAEDPISDAVPLTECAEPAFGEIAFEEDILPETTTDIPENSGIPEEICSAEPIVSDSGFTDSENRNTAANAMPELSPSSEPEEIPPEPETVLPETSDTTEVPNVSQTEEPTDQEYRDNSEDFDNLMQEPAPQPEKMRPSSAMSTTKGRPKRKKGEGLLGIPSILVTFVWLALIVVIGVTSGRMLWICAADVLAFGREDKVVTVTVYEADTMEDIIGKLHAGGLIRYKSLFRLYAGISDAEEDIKPGIYDLNTRYDYHALVNFMSPRSSREVIKLTIPEGYTCRQIFALLEENRICTAVDAAAYAANGELPEYWFLEGLERGTDNCLEGYLFPDTYEFYKNSTPREAIERMLDNFEHRFNEDMLAQLETLNSKVTDGSYGIREIVIIASLIEKESAAPGESPKVAGVIYNRLFRWGNNRPLLNIDASIVYAQEGQNQRIDTKLDHPYNTYLYEGLTPGPIANPGLSSLKAALNPESHNYYYYVLNPATGMHQFSTTYEEHQGYVREFNAAPEIEIE